MPDEHMISSTPASCDRFCNLFYIVRQFPPVCIQRLGSINPHHLGEWGRSYSALAMVAWPRALFNSLWLVWLDGEGRCTKFVEYFIEEDERRGVALARRVLARKLSRAGQ
jgi:hypothetical protein